MASHRARPTQSNKQQQWLPTNESPSGSRRAACSNSVCRVSQERGQAKQGKEADQSRPKPLPRTRYSSLPPCRENTSVFPHAHAPGQRDDAPPCRAASQRPPVPTPREKSPILRPVGEPHHTVDRQQALRSERRPRSGHLRERASPGTEFWCSPSAAFASVPCLGLRSVRPHSR